MFKINNISIAGKFMLIIGAFGLLSVACLMYATDMMRDIDSAYTSAHDHEDRTTLSLRQAGWSLSEARAAISDLELENSEPANHRALDALKKARERFAFFMKTAQMADEARAESIQGLSERGLAIIDETCDSAIKLGVGSTTPADLIAAQNKYLQTCSPAFAPLIQDLGALTVTVERADGMLRSDLSRSTGHTIFVTYIVVLGGLALVMGNAYFAIKAWISVPIEGLVDALGRLAEGDPRITIEGADRKDEIGPMARAVQVFKESTLRLRALETKRLEEHEQQKAVVMALARGMDRLSKGDLTGRLEEGFGETYEKLRTDYNATADSLRTSLRTIVHSTDGITAGADEIARASDDLARRTESQSASVEETSAALTRLSETVNKMAADATTAATVVAATRGKAETSGVIVERAIDAMGRIKDSSLQIGQIVTLIDEIAYQTNMLSLNAEIEAAGAGDAGRGFAVVAAEVRALAQRSAEAAKDIKTLISASTDHVINGVKLVGETGVALTEIIDDVAAMDALVLDISRASREQAAGLGEITSAVTQIDQVVQQNAAMVEESTAAAHALRGDIHDLTGIVGRFEIGAEGKAMRARIAAAEANGGFSRIAKPRPVRRATADSWETV